MSDIDLHFIYTFSDKTINGGSINIHTKKERRVFRYSKEEFVKYAKSLIYVSDEDLVQIRLNLPKEEEIGGLFRMPEWYTECNGIIYETQSKQEPKKQPTMTKDELIKEIGKPFLMPIGFLQGIALLAVIASPFIWLWISWAIAWKLFLTGVGATLLFYGIYNYVYTICAESVDKALEKKQPTQLKSKFQERLEKMHEESKNK